MKAMTWVFLLMTTSVILPQTVGIRNHASVQVKADKPTVSIEYVCQDKSSVQLRLTNNTVWALAFYSDERYAKSEKLVKLGNGLQYYSIPNDVLVSVQFRVDKFAAPTETVKIPKIQYLDSSHTNWVPSDSSIRFTVPRAYLRDDLQVFVRINYEWEVTSRGAVVGGPEHRVSFRGIDLPASAAVCTNARSASL
jgi:hypothetical protein